MVSELNLCVSWELLLLRVRTMKGPGQKSGAFHQEHSSLMFKTVESLAKVSLIPQFQAGCSKLISLKKAVISDTRELR